MTITKIGHVFVDIPPSFMGSKFNPFVISARQELLLLLRVVISKLLLLLNLENNILTNIFFYLSIILRFKNHTGLKLRFDSRTIISNIASVLN